ncbi:peptide chain release factor aRF-1 [Candidatus Pacearchaeota archaeon]|nr:peptide chain release factor aRF-1 [Candidatus Pacearchaeota archaeon]
MLTKEELENVLEELSQHKGRATELISVYIPAGYDVNAVQRQLEAEKSTAKNIKSTATRKNVSEALDKIVRFLKDFKKTPENGMAVFAGNISKKEGQSDMQLWDVEPLQPLKMRLYRCDKEFVLDALQDQLEIDEVFGLLVMDRKEATIGMLEGKRIEMLHKMTSGIPSKIRAGGQSSQRFHRITEGLTRDFYKRVAEEMKKIFFENKKLKGILVGGPVPTKDEFLDGKYLKTQLQEKVIGVKDIGNTDESGLKDLVTASQDVLAEQEIVREKKVLEKFFETLGEKPDLTTRGEKDTKHALNYGAVETLLISKKINKKISKELIDIAKNTGSGVEIISVDNPEGEQFLNLSGIGGILRFRI